MPAACRQECLRYAGGCIEALSRADSEFPGGRVAFGVCPDSRSRLAAASCRNGAPWAHTCARGVSQCCAVGVHVRAGCVAVLRSRRTRARGVCRSVAQPAHTCAQGVSQCCAAGVHVRAGCVAVLRSQCARARTPCRNVTPTVRACAHTVRQRDIPYARCHPEVTSRTRWRVGAASRWESRPHVRFFLYGRAPLEDSAGATNARAGVACAGTCLRPPHHPRNPHPHLTVPRR
jgi:hypothetical protein